MRGLHEIKQYQRVIQQQERTSITRKAGPETAREHGCEPCARAPPQSEARNCRAPAAGLKDLFSGPASGLLRHQDASRVAPLGKQGDMLIVSMSEQIKE